ncbi:MAG TPA: tripartite tricarboxylate transporter substrate binding protein [Burkholderiales bacterium]|jgi:tripartite-type tricarboxylate transporter receptor subunit TctC|nr:tripartite tricarboxylate transporter substrate binding protein [Burkholderiales bacterium]
MNKMIAAACGACCLIGTASAQNYPAKSIRIIVPYPAGGTSDILARLLSAKLNEVFGQTLIVDNRPGANGNIGAELVAKSAADGYTLLLADLGALTISPSIYKLPFDVVKDFAPVTMVTYSPHLLAVHPSVPVKTVKELVALAKSKPGLLNFAVSGIGGAPHLAGVAFEAQTGVKWTYIPYKGGSDAIIGLASGQADAIFNGMLATYPHVKSGKLKLIAVSSSKRVASIPDVPTVAEAGLKDFETGSWQGVVAAAGTPKDIVGRLNTEISRILGTPDMKENLAKQGAEVYTMTPEQLGNWLKTEIDKWAKVVKAANLKL